MQNLSMYGVINEVEASEVILQNPRIVTDNSMRAGQKVTWDCIWFGSYPQAEVIPSGNYSAIGSSYLQEEDIIVDDDLFNILENAKDWNANGDITLHGAKYRRMKKGEATYSTKGVAYQYNWIDDTTYHYFKYEPIKWRVLKNDGEKILLLADKALDNRKNNTVNSGTTWEKSTLRSFLNGYDGNKNSNGWDYTRGQNFFYMAFGSNERTAILENDVIQSDSIYNTSVDSRGNNTSDKVFLLSDSEVYGTDKAKSYGFVSSRYTYDEARRGKCSTYAKAMGVYFSSGSSWFFKCV